MSNQNVDLVRRYFELIDQMLASYWSESEPVPLTEHPQVDEAFNEVDPDAEWQPPHLAEAIRGRDAWLAAISDWLDAADHWRIDVDDVSDLGGDRVLVASRNSIRGKGSGLQIDQGIFTVVTVREAKITAIRDFTERQDAIEAARATKP